MNRQGNLIAHLQKTTSYGKLSGSGGKLENSIVVKR